MLWSPFAPAQVSQFKGWTAVQRELSVRLAPPRAPLPMDQYLPAPGLNLLLGTWYTFGSVHTFQNGLPNSLNMLIWQTSLKPFARDMGQECAAPRMRLNTQVRQVLQRLCQWPAAEAKNPEVMMQYWLSVMGYNAPESEYHAWRDFFLGPDYAGKPAAETIEAMTLAITLNPYFLLHR